MTNIYENGEAPVGEPQEHTFMSFEEFDAYKVSCEQVIENAQAAAKLAQDENFIKIIMEDYFQKEPGRLAGLIASGRMNAKAEEDAFHDLRSIGHLRGYLQDFIAKGNIAAEELINLEAARDEAIAAQNQAD